MAEQMNPVNWFEIPANNLERAKRFYESLLCIELTLTEMGPLKMAWFPMFQGASGATGALVKAEGYAPSHAGTLVYLTVDNIDGMLKRVHASDGNRVALHSNK